MTPADVVAAQNKYQSASAAYSELNELSES